MRRIRVPSVCLSILIAASPLAWGAHRSPSAKLEASTLIIEYNSSAEDVGVQFFLDSEGWTSAEIHDPNGHEIFSAETDGILEEQGGGTEMFLESVEPELGDITFKEFFQRFPVGIYTFSGVSEDGTVQTGKAKFTHAIPAGPVVTAPVDPSGGCAQKVALPVVIDWEPVTKTIFGDPVTIKGYEVIVENEVDVNFDVHIPASAGTSLTISPEALPRGADFIFEVLAIESGGNQTITEGCFSTAP
jgi:hypothetical protein